ncbi:MAG: hypothetical protein ACI9FJ_001367, partial [Alteromonadaceae bacterium]
VVNAAENWKKRVKRCQALFFKKLKNNSLSSYKFFCLVTHRLWLYFASSYAYYALLI